MVMMVSAGAFHNKVFTFAINVMQRESLRLCRSTLPHGLALISLATGASCLNVGGDFNSVLSSSLFPGILH